MFQEPKRRVINSINNIDDDMSSLRDWKDQNVILFPVSFNPLLNYYLIIFI